ncbi:hypothetical protein [Streptomyces sp. NPDC051211]|uniref:hypothetical protein n=1 Tax=Streptomyces sp. NPDC051211 TaxID=3154643 RepID=UPI00344E272A
MHRRLRRALVAAPFAASIALSPLAAAAEPSAGTARAPAVGKCTLVTDDFNQIQTWVTGWEPNQKLFWSPNNSAPFQVDENGQWDGFVTPDDPTRVYYGPTEQESVPCVPGPKPGLPADAIGTCKIEKTEDTRAGTPLVKLTLEGWKPETRLYVLVDGQKQAILRNGNTPMLIPADRAPAEIYYGEDGKESVPCTKGPGVGTEPGKEPSAGTCTAEKAPATNGQRNDSRLTVKLQGWKPGQSLDLDPGPRVTADKSGNATTTVQLRGSGQLKVVFTAEDGKRGSAPCTQTVPKNSVPQQG